MKISKKSKKKKSGAATWRAFCEKKKVQKTEKSKIFRTLHHLGASDRNSSEPATAIPSPPANAEETASDREICPASRSVRSGSVWEEGEG